MDVRSKLYLLKLAATKWKTMGEAFFNPANRARIRSAGLLKPVSRIKEDWKPALDAIKQKYGYTDISSEEAFKFLMQKAKERNLPMTPEIESILNSVSRTDLTIPELKKVNIDTAGVKDYAEKLLLNYPNEKERVSDLFVNLMHKHEGTEVGLAEKLRKEMAVSGIDPTLAGTHFDPKVFKYDKKNMKLLSQYDITPDELGLTSAVNDFARNHDSSMMSHILGKQVHHDDIAEYGNAKLRRLGRSLRKKNKVYLKSLNPQTSSEFGIFGS